jgi:uncharacterized protein YciI
MPLFALLATDAPNTLPRRLEYYAEHRAFVETAPEFGISIILSGPLQTDGGEEMTGSLIIMEAPDRATVDLFAAADPFTTQGIWGEVRISRFLKRLG